ncbi:MAG: FAD-dependent oxidoreductase [Synechococcales cyanobacterium RU_4_20]|nr:FAD-dependent oxidoreductase [Synechococcales cyanobacterium RU_4_20]
MTLSPDFVTPSSDSLLTTAVSRRNLLKMFGVGTVSGTLGYSRFAKPQPNIYGKDALALPFKADRPTTVAVIGGGLAGLAASYELSRRGMAVTLLEKSPQLGGKIASWDINVNGESMRMEHGFHGFFPQYYNLWSLVDELSSQQNFTSLPTYAVVYKAGYEPEVFRPSRSAFPWNIVDLAVASPNCLHWGINLTKPAHWEVFKEITAFDPVKSYARLDHIPVTDWVNGQFPKGLYDLYFLPFAKSSLNAPDRLSTAELMQFFHFYFFGNPEGLAFRGTRQDMGRSLVNPVADSVVENSGKILTDVTVTGIDWQAGQIAQVRYQQGGSGKTAPFWVEANESLGEGFYGAGDDVYALLPGRKGDRPREAVSLTCTHQGCTVHKADDGAFLCPCHGAMFSEAGQRRGGPAQRNLDHFQVLAQDEAGTRLQLVAVATEGKTVAEETVQADYYVFAADVVGMRNLFALSQGDTHTQTHTQVAQLATADPFAVVRMWLDCDFDWEHSNFTSLSGYRLTDSITLYHRIQDDYKAWADRTGGSVVELHSYCYKEAEFPTQKAVLEAFEQELYEIVPQLQGAKILHREIVNQKNFSGFPPHSHDQRPATATAVPNLLFAGDWVKMPFPCGLMERAVSSGLLAANEICQREGLQRRPLLTVNPAGVLSPVVPA